MNCWILLLLLFCNGNCGMSGWGRRTVSDCCDGERRDRDSNRSSDCGCRNDARTESRFDSRPFISFQNSTCGCEEARSNDDCDCN